MGLSMLQVSHTKKRWVIKSHMNDLRQEGQGNQTSTNGTQDLDCCVSHNLYFFLFRISSLCTKILNMNIAITWYVEDSKLSWLMFMMSIVVCIIYFVFAYMIEGWRIDHVYCCMHYLFGARAMHWYLLKADNDGSETPAGKVVRSYSSCIVHQHLELDLCPYSLNNACSFIKCTIAGLWGPLAELCVVLLLMMIVVWYKNFVVASHHLYLSIYLFCVATALPELCMFLIIVNTPNRIVFWTPF